MSNATLSKFGYPDTLIDESEHWATLLRPQQVTLGSLVLGAKSAATAFADLPSAAFVDLERAIRRIETALKAEFQYQKINYLMLMMVDPHVHFHVIPRYAEIQTFAELPFSDTAWPGPPQLDQINPLSAHDFAALRDHLRAVWAVLS